MNRASIIIADSGETSRKMVSDLISKRGYKIYQVSDNAGALRMARSLHPDLVLMDVNLWGANAYETASIIEEDKLSTVIFMTTKLDNEFMERLKRMKVFAYITKPVNPAQLIQMVEFTIINSTRIRSLEERVKKLEGSLAARKKIERAKGILMEKLGFSEQQAYEYMRKKSMDKGISMESLADTIADDNRV